MRKALGLILGIYVLLGSVLLADATAVRTIIVYGDGEIITDADRLSFYVRLEGLDKDLEKAKAANDLQLGKIEEIFTLFSIPENQADISRFEVDPQYEYNTGNFIKIQGYRVSRTVTIKLDNIDDYELLVDAVIGAGIYDIGGLQYDLSNSAEMHARARENALIKARQKAEQMAAVYNQKVGQVLEMLELKPQGSYFPTASGSFSNVARQDFSEAESEGFLGKMVFKARLQVTFELK